jgi:hypothetical protein
LAFLTQNAAKLCKNLTITVVFEKNSEFLLKIVGNDKKCDHTIDPRKKSFPQKCDQSSKILTRVQLLTTWFAPGLKFAPRGKLGPPGVNFVL